MRYLIRAFLMVGIAIVGVRGVAIADVGAEPQFPVEYFGICSENVSTIDIVNEGRQGLPVMIITLTPAGQEELHELTKALLGRELDVAFDGISLGKNVVHAPVDSGIIFSREWRSIGAAQAVAELIRDDAIDAPCGLLENLDPGDSELAQEGASNDSSSCWYPDAVDTKYERQMSKRATKKMTGKRLSSVRASSAELSCEGKDSACFVMEQTQLSGLSGDFRSVKYRLCVKHTDGIIQEAQHIQIEQVP